MLETPPSREDDDSLETTQFLAARAKEGDQEAWNKLFVRHRSILRALIHGRIPAKFRGRFDTEDLISSTFLTAYERIATFEYRGDESLRIWLRQILLNKYRDRLRHHTRSRRDAGRDGRLSANLLEVSEVKKSASPSEILEWADKQSTVLLALSKMEPKDQEIIGLRVFDKLEWPEVSNRLEMTESAVRRRFVNAVQKLVKTVA